MTILSADIGGTNSRFAYFKNMQIKFKSAFKTNDFCSFSELLNALEKSNGQFEAHKCGRFVFAIPGPVTSADLLSFPNIKWKISKSRLQRIYPEIEISFINDFTAQAYGCLTEATANALPIINTEQQRSNDIAIIGAGTGLGHGTLKQSEKGNYLHIPSEAGHIPFPFTSTAFEQKYLDFIVQQTGNVCPVGDDVVSGKGLTLLHQFLTGKKLCPEKITQEIHIDSETTQWFARFYARDCRNYVLTTLATGGKLFISGGVAIKNPFLINNETFKEEFRKGSDTAEEVLKDVSVFLIQNEEIGLWGAARYAVHI